MTNEKEFKNCPFHNVELVHTKLEDGTSKDYCPEDKCLLDCKI